MTPERLFIVLRSVVEDEQRFVRIPLVVDFAESKHSAAWESGRQRRGRYLKDKTRRRTSTGSQRINQLTHAPPK